MQPDPSPLSAETRAAERAYGEICVEAALLDIPLDDPTTPHSYAGMAMAVTLVRKGHTVERAMRIGRLVDRAVGASAVRATVERGAHDAIETKTTLGGANDPVARGKEDA